ncbi:MAG TPA: lysylphosphatidylglycerol synthase transmembrane domain-containing protein [Candidatus Woesebacteria bacterium]|nr:lysylphosphatidylglycerol synthase transmembrane domain-containing protein [Candidatus Woesebacteria bacterium]
MKIIFKVILTLVLLVLAFNKVNIVDLLKNYAGINWWNVVLIVVYLGIILMITSYRWALLLLNKVKLVDIIRFTHSSFLGNFYGLFIPSSLGVDLIKWVPLKSKYKEISKKELITSVIIDRLVGFTGFCTMAFLSVILGLILKFNFSEVILYLFIGLFVGVIIFWVLIFSIDFSKIRFLTKYLETIEMIKKENKIRLVKAYIISLILEPLWVFQIWWYSQIFNAGFSLINVLIIMPIIYLLLVLPISIAGFGAREQLFLYFFGQLGYEHQKILAVSTFNGLINIINALVGGVLQLF